METFDYDSNIILDSDTIVSGSAMPDSMMSDAMMPDNMMYGDVMPEDMMPEDGMYYDAMPTNVMFGDVLPDDMMSANMMPDEFGRGSRPGQGPNTCRNCSYFRPNNNLMFWTWQLFGPNVNRPQSAQVRFFNATSIREPLDIYLNNRLVLSNLGRMEASGFLNIVPGTYRLTVFRRGPLGRPIVNTNVSFNRNSSQLLTILGSMNNARVQVTGQ